MSAVQANVAEVLAKTEVSTITLSEEPPSKRSAGNRLLIVVERKDCLLYTSPSPRDKRQSRMPSSA